MRYLLQLKPLIMEKKINTLLLFFVFVVLISLVGFFKSYLTFFPEFNRFPFVIHLHFLAFVSWFSLLIIQPILIKRKNLLLHRKVGKLSYLVAPVLLITIMILVTKQVQRELQLPNNQAATTAFIGLIDILSFSLFYSIAMFNSRNTRWHVAFLMASTLVVLNPGLSRLLNQIQFGLGMTTAVFLPFIFSISLLILEKIKYKKSILRSPYFLYLCIWTLVIILFATIPQTAFWSKFVAETFG